MAEGTNREFLSFTVFAFVKRLADRNKRGRALKRLAVLAVKWLLAGCGISALVALGEIMELGLALSWSRYGKWWLITPLLVTMIPAAFVAFIVTLECVAFIIVAPFWLPALLFGDRWYTALRRMAVFAMFAFIAWFAWSIGTGIATDSLVRPPSSAVIPPSAPPAGSGFHIDVLGWLQAHPIIGAVLAFFAGPLFNDWVRAKKFFEPKPVPPP